MAKKARSTRSQVSGGKRKRREKNPLGTSSLVPVPANSRKDRKRIGQGPGSGMGKTSTRGQKGQKARASSSRPGFEGGQMRLALRMPKRGFTNIFKEAFQAVNIAILDKKGMTGDITPELLEQKGIIKDSTAKIKVLGTGEIKTAINITVDAASKSAVEKITKAGGQVIIRVKKIAEVKA
jgi:large subunit ribosomal protein L15